ncbi:cell adhesion molecule, putative [Perkinsus marinus ATCC 50983]|uniref:Cell adhesion molecule, putative n=1 Tax=Perkinsus marinus (strain ATCC 50983 / TXsc) TaxID=423536 RepID=C5LTE8_PERM5|nr:cell adhesion molecule, putative [Perkinsus marinus ATCC 50983]EER00116.1 cell adhesion molecule, putative [Perkinsus marinus ATCC 50983]|eukprot:XP_002767398.1 cell adhesion molecule, putative [Perkinsus marinus ATCC 50983]
MDQSHSDGKVSTTSHDNDEECTPITRADERYEDSSTSSKHGGGKCYALRYWVCMIFCCRPPHEMTDEEREEWEKRSFWDKYKPAFFCFIRYFIMLIIGILVGIGIFFLVLYCMGIIGGSSNNDTSNNTIDLGELQYPTVVSGYTNISITISPIAAASPYDPKDYLIETQVATGGSGGGRRLRSDGPWTVSLEVPYDKDHPTTATLTGLTAGEQLLIRYKIEMEDGRVSSPSVAVMEGTKDPTAPSAPGLMAFNTTDRSVSVSIIPPTTTNSADITAYVIQHALASSSSSNDTTPDSSWTKAEISKDDASKPYTVNGLSPGQAVVLRVLAENSAGESDNSKPYTMVADQTEASTPDKVRCLAVQSTTSNSASLNWTAPADNGAMILRYIISEGDNTYTVDGHDTSYTVTGLSRGSDYTFYIVAKNSQGDSPKSDGVSTATTESCEADPPSNVMLQTPFSDGVSVSWSKAKNNLQCDLPVTAYRVIDDDGNELCQVAANDDDGALWCDVTGLQPSTSYNIRVQAKNSAAGWSTKSSSPVKMSTIASGKCNTRDQIRWWVTTTNPVYNSMDFTDALSKCGVQGLGNADKVSSCLIDYTEDPSKTPFNLPPITDDCSMCYGVNGNLS